MTSSARALTSAICVTDLGRIDYLDAWELQKDLLAKRAAGSDDQLLLLEHNSVYTAGRRTLPEDRPTDVQVIDVDRGGMLTWHGPGQLVGYPIVGLSDPIDVVHYVRCLEQAIISVGDQLSVPVGRVEGRSGVWLAAADGKPERKIAAIGIRVAQGITMHGFSINADCDLDNFDKGTPCGLHDVGVTSFSEELGRDVSIDELKPLITPAVHAALSGDLPITNRNLARPQPEAVGVTFALRT
jgi:lipoyl(octanoyl) transferase